jgi:hypothetical protein
LRRLVGCGGEVDAGAAATGEALGICKQGVEFVLLLPLVCAVSVEPKNRADETKTDLVGSYFYE